MDIKIFISEISFNYLSKFHKLTPDEQINNETTTIIYKTNMKTDDLLIPKFFLSFRFKSTSKQTWSNNHKIRTKRANNQANNR